MVKRLCLKQTWRAVIISGHVKKKKKLHSLGVDFEKSPHTAFLEVPVISAVPLA